jgi:hypothetical protein
VAALPTHAVLPRTPSAEHHPSQSRADGRGAHDRGRPRLHAVRRRGPVPSAAAPQPAQVVLEGHEKTLGLPARPVLPYAQAELVHGPECGGVRAQAQCAERGDAVRLREPDAVHLTVCAPSKRRRHPRLAARLAGPCALDGVPAPHHSRLAFHPALPAPQLDPVCSLSAPRTTTPLGRLALHPALLTPQLDSVCTLTIPLTAAPLGGHAGARDGRHRRGLTDPPRTRLR